MVILNETLGGGRGRGRDGEVVTALANVRDSPEELKGNVVEFEGFSAGTLVFFSP